MVIFARFPSFYYNLQLFVLILVLEFLTIVLLQNKFFQETNEFSICSFIWKKIRINSQLKHHATFSKLNIIDQMHTKDESWTSWRLETSLTKPFTCIISRMFEWFSIDEASEDPKTSLQGQFSILKIEATRSRLTTNPFFNPLLVHSKLRQHQTKKIAALPVIFEMQRHCFRRGEQYDSSKESEIGNKGWRNQHVCCAFMTEKPKHRGSLNSPSSWCTRLSSINVGICFGWPRLVYAV